MAQIKTIILSVCLLFVLTQVQGQQKVSILSFLQERGFENIRIVEDQTGIWIGFEDRVDKYPWIGLADLIKMVRKNIQQKSISVNLEQKGIPMVNLIIEPNGVYSISNRTQQCALILSAVKRIDPAIGKVEVTALPQFMIRNARLDKIFTFNASIAPTIHLQLWKGAEFAAQAILPIYNNMQEQFDHVRPGIISLSQYARMGNHWRGVVSIGNFTRQRMGITGQIDYETVDGRWTCGIEAGLTGSSTTWNGKWEISRWEKVNAFGGIGYYVPNWNVAINVKGGRYLAGDYGGEVMISRRFGATTVWVYGMRSDSQFNGGFGFNIPFFQTKRSRIPSVSIWWPRWFDWQYSAQSGPKYVNKGLGITYHSRLYERAEKFYWNPNYIFSQIKSLIK